MAAKREFNGSAGDWGSESVAEGRMGKINTTETAVVITAVYGESVY